MTSHLDWMIIGAGPAGIATVGKLLDQGIQPEKIGWMDPYFQVGDLGRKWSNVSSNTQVELFRRFLLDCEAFSYKNCSKTFPLDQMEPNATCLLKFIAEPLQWVSNHLKKKVKAVQETAIALNLINNTWEIKAKEKSFFSKNVVLAIGSDEKSLSYPGKEIISLATAIDFEELKKQVGPKDTIAVFGSSHSAVLILANLVKAKVKGIINFYRSPHHYAVYLEDWILFDNTGLKGVAAEWAKKHLDGKHPANLKRMRTSDHIFDEALALCNKVIYAVGFEGRKIPVLEQYETAHYNDKTELSRPVYLEWELLSPGTI